MSASATPAAPSASAARPTRSVAPSPTVAVDRKPAAQRTTQAPTQAPPKRATEPAPAACEIVSNAGNCYKAGQFCRKADVGRSTHAANGRIIHCRQDDGQPRWGY